MNNNKYGIQSFEKVTDDSMRTGLGELKTESIYTFIYKGSLGVFYACVDYAPLKQNSVVLDESSSYFEIRWKDELYYAEDHYFRDLEKVVFYTFTEDDLENILYFIEEEIGLGLPRNQTAEL